jgi:hypothetical protein
MPRLIDADALQTSIALYAAENAYINDTALDVLEMVSKWLDEAPAIDAEPVRHGTWEEIETYAFVGFDGNGSLKERRQKYYRHICGRCSAIKENSAPPAAR